MLRVVTFSVVLLSLACSGPAASPSEFGRARPQEAPAADAGAAAQIGAVAVDAGGDTPSLCQAVARAGGRCSPEGVPLFEGNPQPRVRLLSECEAAAKLHRPCSNQDGWVLEIEY